MKWDEKWGSGGRGGNTVYFVFWPSHWSGDITNRFLDLENPQTTLGYIYRVSGTMAIMM